MPFAHDHRPLARRTVLGALIAMPLAGCAVRFEDDAPLPGPKAKAAPDTKPLEQARVWLVDAMSAAEKETTHTAEASAAQTLHRQHLTRLDATLKGLGAKNLPSVTATSTPTASSTTSPKPSAKASSSSSPAPPSASSSTSSTTGRTSAWTSAESVWATSRATDVIARVSATSRPLVMSIAAASLAAVTAVDVTPRWPSDITMPRTDGTLLSALDAVIDALEWSAARTDPTKRDEVSAQLAWAYAARSRTQAAMPVGAGGKRQVWRSYTSQNDARNVARNAALGVTSAAAKDVKEARTGREAGGMLFAWSGAVSVARQLGDKPRPFPGLAV